MVERNGEAAAEGGGAGCWLFGGCDQKCGLGNGRRLRCLPFLLPFCLSLSLSLSLSHISTSYYLFAFDRPITDVGVLKSTQLCGRPVASIWSTSQQDAKIGQPNETIKQQRPRQVDESKQCRDVALVTPATASAAAAAAAPLGK